MYCKGDLRWKRQEETIGDSSTLDIAAIHGPCAYLPHSCDKWVIGKPANVKRLIEDLQNFLKENDEN